MSIDARTLPVTWTLASRDDDAAAAAGAGADDDDGPARRRDGDGCKARFSPRSSLLIPFIISCDTKSVPGLVI